MPTAIHRKIALAETGKLDSAIARLPSGWVIAGDVQPLKGYCILMANPVSKDFNALSEEARAQYGRDMGRVGDALLEVLGAYRINYETWGNLDPALHTHIVPRYLDEPDALRVQTPRQAYDWAKGPAFKLDEHADWMREVARYLAKFI